MVNHLLWFLNVKRVKCQKGNLSMIPGVVIERPGMWLLHLSFYLFPSSFYRFSPLLSFYSLSLSLSLASTSRLHTQIDLSLPPEGVTAWACVRFSFSFFFFFRCMRMFPSVCKFWRWGRKSSTSIAIQLTGKKKPKQCGGIIHQSWSLWRPQNKTKQNKTKQKYIYIYI